MAKQMHHVSQQNINVEDPFDFSVLMVIDCLWMTDLKDFEIQIFIPKIFSFVALYQALAIVRMPYFSFTIDFSVIYLAEILNGAPYCQRKI